jgi:hypothetical protein
MLRVITTDNTITVYLCGFTLLYLQFPEED